MGVRSLRERKEKKKAWAGVLRRPQFCSCDGVSPLSAPRANKKGNRLSWQRRRPPPPSSPPHLDRQVQCVVCCLCAAACSDTCADHVNELLSCSVSASTWAGAEEPFTTSADEWAAKVGRVSRAPFRLTAGVQS